jgi:hypothetical protein
MPSVISSSSWVVFPSWTVMTPSFPTFSMARAKKEGEEEGEWMEEKN